MITKSNFISQEYSGNQKFDLKDIISIEAFNNSDVAVVINKFVIEPSKRCFVVSPDFTVSDVVINLSFMPIPVISNPNQQNNRPSVEVPYSQVPDIIPAIIAPNLKQSVVLYIKSLSKNF